LYLTVSEYAHLRMIVIVVLCHELLANVYEY